MAALLLGAGGCASRGPGLDFRLESLLDDAERKAYVVDQFCVDIVKTKHSSHFRRDMVVRGRLVFQKPDKLRLVIKGDVNVEILANAKSVTLIHDSKDTETVQAKGESDSPMFSDPLMQLINGLGTRLLKEFKVTKQVMDGGGLMLEVKPGVSGEFEAIDRVQLLMGDG